MITALFANALRKRRESTNNAAPVLQSMGRKMQGLCHKGNVTMDRLTVIDRIVRELYRQAAKGPPTPRLMLTKGNDPDTFVVGGVLDVDRLAKAVRDEP